MWTAGSRRLQHNNALANTVLSNRQFLTIHLIPTYPSLTLKLNDISHSDISLFPQLKMTLKGGRYQTVEGISLM
jgi:hypothetical protein